MGRFYIDLEEVTEAVDGRLTALDKLVGSVTRPGDYCAHGRMISPMPRIEIDPVGVLSFPVPQMQAQALIAAAERAPYGRGAETIIDPGVRDCWQVAPEGIEIAGRAWNGTFRDILNRAAEGIGYPRNAVSTELYKLLVYETGGFFAPHRDTEKAERMVATLVISLPVAGAGGELVVRHQTRESVINMTTDEPSELVWAVFYADCEHEILPVTEGHRVCLIYNLMLEPGSGLPAKAPDYDALIEPIATELSALCRNSDTSGKLVWLLEHDYSEAGLSFDTLKNTDAAVGRLLSAAAGRADYLLHAAILYIEDSFSADYHGYGYVDEIEDVRDEDFELYDRFETCCSLDSWVHPDGMSGDFGAMPLLEGELISAERLDLEFPDTQRLMEATGNAAATVERIYHLAALVLWPRLDTLRILESAGTQAVMSFLVGEQQRALSGIPLCGPVRDLADRVANSWPSPSPYKLEVWLKHSAEVLGVLCAIENREALLRFVQDRVLPHYHDNFNDTLLAVAERIGAGAMGEMHRELVTSKLPRHVEGIVDLAMRLCEQMDRQVLTEDGNDREWQDVLQEMVQAICAQVPCVDRDQQQNWSPLKKTISLPVDTLELLFKLARRFGLEHEADGMAAFFIGREDLVPPARTIPALLEKLHAEPDQKTSADTAFAALWSHSARFLMSRSRVPPEPPTDWRLPTDGLSCKCQYCEELRGFCLDPVASEYRFRARESSRGHIEHEISKAKQDMDCYTVSKGRPYTLVCTKTRAAHERRLKQYGKDIEGMRILASVAGAVPAFDPTTEVLQAAIGRFPGTRNDHLGEG